MRKIKENINSSKRKTINIQGNPLRLSGNFSAEILQARREWHNIFTEMKGENLQPRILSHGEGNGNPLQYSCLENPMDRGAWQAIVHGVARVGHDLATKPPPK